MKKYLLLVFSAIFMISVAATAQGNKKGKGPSIENRVDKMATDLELNAAEKASVLSILTKQEAELKTFRAEVDKESPDFKTKMKNMRTAQDAELKAAIGVEKFKKLQAMRAEERANLQKKAE